MAEPRVVRIALPYPASIAVPVLGLCVLALIGSGAAPWWAAAGAVIVGVVAWTLLEYVLHRFVLHRLEPFRAWHLAHHHEPLVPIRVPVAFSVALVLAVVGLPLTLMGTDGLAAPFSAGLLLGNVLQEAVHQRLHAPQALGSRMTRLRTHHGYHHFQSEQLAFGTLTAFWDRCFGTAPPRVRAP